MRVALGIRHQAGTELEDPTVTIIAIDPGRGGGIAWNEIGFGIRAVPMPETEQEIARRLRLIRDTAQVSESKPIKCYMEAVTGFIKPPKKKDDPCPVPWDGETVSALKRISTGDFYQEIADMHNQEVESARHAADDGNRQPAHLMHKFGRSVGNVVGALHALEIPFIEVYAVTWQKVFSLSLRGKNYSQRKSILRNAAQHSFPQIKVTLKTADALLIWRYAELEESQDLFNLPDVAEVDGKHHQISSVGKESA